MSFADASTGARPCTRTPTGLAASSSRAAAALATGIGLTGPAAAHLSLAGIADATTRPLTISASREHLKQINAGLLNVGYTESGPVGGPAVLLLHGWPYDIDSFAEVVPLLTAQGYRVIVPYLRGYGTTRFLSSETFRNGQQSALAVDIIALMDALKIEKAVVGGFDWGARTANIMAALWPQRVSAMVSVSGYLIGNQQAGKVPLPPKAELEWWYQYYFATERGRIGYEKNRREFARLIWKLASPKWNFDDATFERSAAGLRQSGPRRDRDSQLSLAAWIGRRRTSLRRVRGPTGHGADHRCADHYHGKRRQRRAASRSRRLREEVHRQVRAPAYRRRHRPQSSSGSAGAHSRRPFSTSPRKCDRGARIHPAHNRRKP